MSKLSLFIISKKVVKWKSIRGSFFFTIYYSDHKVLMLRRKVIPDSLIPKSIYSQTNYHAVITNSRLEPTQFLRGISSFKSEFYCTVITILLL